MEWSGKVILRGLGAIGLALTLAAPASAVTFDYSNVAGFRLGSATQSGPAGGANIVGGGGIEFFNLVGPTLGPPPGAAPVAVYQAMGWGCSGVNPPTNPALCANGGAIGNGVTLSDPRGVAGRSSLEIVGINGTVTVGGAFENIAHLTHWNNPIAGNVLTGATIDNILRIGSNPPFTQGPDATPITFLETHNVSPCPAPFPALGPDCRDEFSVLTVNLAPLAFTSDGVNYVAEFQLFTTDPDIIIIPGPTSVTVLTAESSINDLFVQMRILAVPGPASLMLLGMGLTAAAAVGSRIRRRK